MPAGRFIRLGVECEIAVVLGEPLPAGDCTLESAARAVESAHAAVELVDDRYEDFTARQPPLLGWAADDFFHCGLALSAPMQIDPIALDSFRGAMWVREADNERQENLQPHECVGEGSGADIIQGHPLNSLVWLANSEVAHALGGLPSGWVVSHGSVTKTAWVRPCPWPGTTVSVRFAHKDQGFDPESSDSLSRLSHHRLGCAKPSSLLADFHLWLISDAEHAE